MTKEELEKEKAELQQACHKWFMRWREAKKDALYFDSSLYKQIEATLKLQQENAELETQIEKMKCCGNCRFSESDKLNGTFCHREGCFVVASAKCKLWED